MSGDGKKERGESAFLFPPSHHPSHSPRSRLSHSMIPCMRFRHPVETTGDESAIYVCSLSLPFLSVVKTSNLFTFLFESAVSDGKFV